MCIDDAVWVVEFASIVALIVMTALSLRLFLREKPAAIATAMLLPLLGMIQFAPALHVWLAPYDTPALVFVVAGFYLARTGRYGWLTALCLPAALNRETAIMLPLAAVAMRPEHWRRMVPAVVVVLAVRAGLHLSIDAGPVAETSQPDGDGTPYIIRNFWVLFATPSNGWAVLLVHLSCLPLAWAAVWREIPADLRRLGWVSLAVGIGMMCVGGVDEPRIFGEAAILSYIPVSVGVWRWALSDEPALDVGRAVLRRS